MSMNVYARIAERYQVPPSDDEAVERFFLDVAPTLSREERESIVAELLADDAQAQTPATADVPLEVPVFSIDEAPPLVRPAVSQLSAGGKLLEKFRNDRWLRSGLVYADVQETVRAVVRRMAEAHADIVAIRDQERLVGVLSEHDVIMRVVAEGLNPDDTAVAAVMTEVN